MRRTILRAASLGGLIIGLLMPAITIALPATPLGAATKAADNELRVVINGLSSDDGIVRVALFSDPESFPKPGKQRVVMEARVTGGVANVLFRHLPPGHYAIVAFHDKNANGKFDRTLLGLPKEGYGFSRTQRANLSPPKFEDAAVKIEDQPVTVDVHVNYRTGA